MKFFTKIMTTTAVVSLLVVGTSAVYAMDGNEEKEDTDPAGTHVKLRYVEGKPGEWRLLSTEEAGSSTTTSTSTPPTSAIQEEPTSTSFTPSSSSSTSVPTPMSQTDAILSLLGAVAQEAPNIRKILKNTPTPQPQEQSQQTPTAKLVSRGQELLQDPEVANPLLALFDRQKVEEWAKGLNSISQTGFTPHDWERNTNKAVCGIYDKSHKVMQIAFQQADHAIIKKVVQHPELLKNWMSKADRFPRQGGVAGSSMEEVLNFEKAEYEKSQS